MVFFDLVHEQITPAQLSAALRQLGVLLNPSGGRRLRAVLNYHVAKDDIDKVITAFRRVLTGQAAVETKGVFVYE